MKRVFLILTLLSVTLLSYALRDVTIGGVVFTDADNDGYFDVSSKQHLIAMSIQPSALDDRKFEQTADIIFNPDPALEDWDNDGSPDGVGTKGFKPIGLTVYNDPDDKYDRYIFDDYTTLKEFSGGQYIIKHFYINRPAESNVGLFRELYNVYSSNNNEYPEPRVGNRISNVKLIECNITGGTGVGGIAGNIKRIFIDGCLVSGSVKGGNSVGGLVGESRTSDFSYSCSRGLVSGNLNVGGIIGLSSEDGSMNFIYTTSDLRNCNVKSAVTGKGYVGSLVGKADFCNAYDCLSSGFTNCSNEGRGRLVMHENLEVYMKYIGLYNDQQTTTINNDDNGFDVYACYTDKFNSQNLYLDYGTSSSSPWLAPSEGRPFLFTQKMSVDNSTVDVDGHIEGHININPTSNISIIECGAMYKSTHADSSWHTVEFADITTIAGTIPHLVSGNTYYICAYAIDQNGNKHLGDMVKWQERKVIYHKNLSQDDEVETLVPLGSYFNLNFDAFNNPGYSISEWSTNPQGSYGMSYYDGDSILIEDDELRLYARWALNEYTINYDSNLGLGTMPQQNFLYSDNVSLLTNMFTKSGYKLSGWNTQLDGSGIALNEQHTFLMPDSSMMLYAQWEIDGHYINYYPNGGLGQMTSLLVGTGMDTTLSLNSFNNVGYQFSGWNTEQNGNGLFYTDEAELTMGNSNIDLYAQWLPYAYTINYLSNNGTGFMPAQEVGYGDNVQLDSSIYNREGYVFSSWNTDINGFGKKYLDQESFTKGLGDVNLYAQWNPISYSIVYKNTENALNPNSNTYTIETPTIELAHCIQKNKAFDGWYVDSLFLQVAQQIPQGSMGDRVLYAKWSNEFKIAYYSNGGDGSTIIENITISGTDYTVKHNSYSRRGYDFMEWNTLPDASGITYFESQNITLNDSIDFILFAIWSPINYSINYESSIVVANPNLTNYNVLTPSFAFTDLSVTGFTFNGWYADSLSLQDVRFLPLGTVGDTTLYANWSRNQYAINYCKNYGDGKIIKHSYYYDTDTALVSCPFSRKGYKFIAWNTLSNGNGTAFYDKEAIHINDQDQVLYAQWELVDYTIHYHNLKGLLNTNPSQYTIYSESHLLADLELQGYTFNGWFKDSALTIQTNLISQGDTGLINFYAKWEINKYQILYKKNGGAGTMSTQSVIYGIDTFLLKNTYQRKGYHFTHWNSEIDNSGVDYSDKESILMGDKSITLYAQWVLQNYTINYHDVRSAANANPSEYNVTSEETVLSDLELEGYTFTGWYNDSIYTTHISSIAKGDTGHIDLYAKWEINDYQISYNKNAGSGAMPSQYLDYEEDAFLLAIAYQRIGYEFSHWNTEADNSGIDYVDTQAIKMSSNDLELYAQWDLMNYSIDYHNLMGVAPSSPRSYNTTQSVVLESLVKDDYDFLGWYINEDFTYLKNTISVGDTGHITLYAKWEIKSFDVEINNGGFGYVKVNNTDAEEHNIDVDYGDTLAVIHALSDAGNDYIFTGWSDGVKANPRSLNNIMSDTTISALWEKPISIVVRDTVKVYNGLVQEVDVMLDDDVDYIVEYKEETALMYSNRKPFYAGRYDVRVTIIGNGVYGVREAKFMINRKPLTVTVEEDQSKAYGAREPDSLFYNAIGLIDGDVIYGELKRTDGEAPGYYSIILGSLEAVTPDVDMTVIPNNVTNYEISFVGADFYINSNIEIYCKWEYLLIVDNCDNAFASYQWYKDGSPIEGATNQSFYNEDHTLCGIYQCEVSCIGSSQKILTEPVSYEYCAVMQSRSLNIYPNPVEARSQISIELPSGLKHEGLDVRVYSQNGSLLESRFSSVNDKLFLQAPSMVGLYKVIVTSDNKTEISHTILVR